MGKERLPPHPGRAVTGSSADARWSCADAPAASARSPPARAASPRRARPACGAPRRADGAPPMGASRPGTWTLRGPLPVVCDRPVARTACIAGSPSIGNGVGRHPRDIWLIEGLCLQPDRRCSIRAGVTVIRRASDRYLRPVTDYRRNFIRLPGRAPAWGKCPRSRRAAVWYDDTCAGGSGVEKGTCRCVR